jgi:hypothetical protein
VVAALKILIFGAILVLAGFSVTVCGLVQNALGIPHVISSLISTSVGSLVFGFKFKQWIESI